MDLHSIGKNIRKFRRMQKLSQSDFAEKVGLSTNYIGAIERGEKIPALETLITIINALGISSDMLLCDVVDAGYNVKASVLADEIDKITPEDRAKIFDVIEVMIRHSKKVK